MELNNILIEGLRPWDIEIDEKQLEKFKDYMDILLEYNKVMNLTAIEDPFDIYTKHFLDSLSCLMTDKLKSGVKAIDVGTGAGFPSIPVKIMRPDINITLLDSLNKRINFLKEVSSRLGIENVTFLHSRAEDAARDKNHRGSYDIVLSRAVASLPVLLEYCSPFLKTGGYMICQKGPMAEKELEDSKKALKILSMSVECVIDADIAFTDLHHKLLIIKKTAPTPQAYPRKAGTPSKQPLI